MSSLLKVEWTILSTETPAINRPCGRCGTVRSFGSSGKFRLNANGSRIDAWLIYRCLSCGKRWNRPVFERRLVRNMQAKELEALQTNDAAYAEQIAHQTGLPGAVPSSGRTPQFEIDARITGQNGDRKTAALLTIRNPASCRARLDQILAKGLLLARRKVLELAQTEALVVQDASRKVLKKPIQKVVLIKLNNQALTRALETGQHLGEVLDWET